MPSLQEIICLLVGSFFVFWYAWLMDDAYIYFRYVDNLVIHGNGLVFNPGEYVEGISSPAWPLVLSGFRLLHLDYWTIVRGIGLLCFFMFWWLACLVNRGLTSTINSTASGDSRGLSFNLPLIYLCCTYGVSCYFTSGIDTPLVSLTAAVYAAAILWPQNRLLQGIVGVSPLIRHELFIPYLLFLAYAFFIKKARPYTALVLFTLCVGGYEIFRVWYYADFFPNTFYLKNISWLVQGLSYVYDTMLAYQTIPFLLFMSLVFVALLQAGIDKLWGIERLAMLVLAFPILIYVVKIGGDPRHFRFLVFPFILIILASGGLIENFIAKFTPVRKQYTTLFAVVFGIAVASQYPRQLQQHPIFRSHFGYNHHTFLMINDASGHRFNSRGLTPSWRSFGNNILTYAEARKRYADKTVSLERDVPWLGTSILQKGEKPLATPIIMESWCQPAFLYPGLPTIHSLGYTDPILARTLMPVIRPAHKMGLLELASDIVRIRRQHGFKRGAFDLAVSNDPKTPAWIARNINSIRLIEKKVYNNHDFFENVQIAFTPIRHIDPETAENN